MRKLVDRIKRLVIKASESELPDRPYRRGGFHAVAGLHIFTLFNLAVTMPLYNLLGQADLAPLFIARQSQAIDVWLMILSLSVLIPAVLCLLLRLLSQLSMKLAYQFFTTLVFILFTAFFLPMSGRWLAAPGYLVVGSAILAAMLATSLYRKKKWASTFISIMSLGIIAAPVLFLASPSVKSILAKQESQKYSLEGTTSDLPNLVMIIFDELPLISLLNEQHEIDKVRYPNFHRLAGSANWYRNTTAIHYSTSHAVAGLMIGDDLPNYHDSVYGSSPTSSGPLDRTRAPYNIFSLLEDTHAIYANELVTRLAPEPNDSGPYIPPLKERLVELGQDTLIVYGHMLSPETLRGHLPQIEGQWRGFASERMETTETPDWPYKDSFKRLSVIQQFIESIQKRNQPSFYFLHSLLPHFPFAYNEEGQIHSLPFGFLTMHFREATGTIDWPDQTTAEMAYQAHLLQLGFVDVLLGRIIDHLESLGLYDDAMILVTSDHGTSYYWGSSDTNPDELARIQAAGTLYVPWILKLPGQSIGNVFDKPMQTIDIAPTLGDLLGIDIPWEVGGLSATDHVPLERKRFSYLPLPLTFTSYETELEQALNYKLSLFGSNTTKGIQAIGPYKELLGMATSEFTNSPSSAKVTIENLQRFKSVKPKSPTVPAYIEGHIDDLPTDLSVEPIVVAVAINGIIRSTSKTTALKISSLRPQGSRPVWNENSDQESKTGNPMTQRDHFFLAYLPADSFKEGHNEITIHGLIPDDKSNVVELLEIELKLAN
ncbi:sulfatase-like hydrolase/transferase [Pseudomonadota bacterium]